MADSQKILSSSEVKELPIGTRIRVTEMCKSGLNEGKIRGSRIYEVGERMGKKVLYSLPYKSSFIEIRNYKHLIFERGEDTT